VACGPTGARAARGVQALVRLPGAERDGERQAGAVRDEVQLGREAAAATPEHVVGGLARRPVSLRARGVAMRPDVAAVDTPELPVDPAGVGQLALERRPESSSRFSRRVLRRPRPAQDADMRRRPPVWR